MDSTHLTPETFRRRFPILRNRVYVNSCSQGALSTDVEDAALAHLESWRTKGSPWDEWMEEVERLRAAFARHIGAEPGEVAVVPSASVAASVVASALDFGGVRRAVVTTEFEFPTMGHVWLAQQRRGADVRWVKPQHGDLPIVAFDPAIDADAGLVATTHVCYRNGYRVDVAALARLCHDRGAWLLVDDYQRTGTGPIDVRALGVDILVTGALKYLLGPSGVAFLYVRSGLIPQLEPTVTGWFGRANPFAFVADVLDWAPDAHRFESGTPPVPNAYMARAGLNLLAQIGSEAIERQIQSLGTRFLACAAAEGFGVLTPGDPLRRGPLCVIRSHDAQELARRLALRGIVCSARGEGLRVSFHAYNNHDDVDAVIGALRAEAALVNVAS